MQRTVLIIDDEPSVRMTLEYFLGLAGYRVIGADSGPRAIALAATESVDGALIDVHMPVMNGIETCLRLQEQARALDRTLRVWFMTGAANSTIERRAVEFGTFGVFQKPFNFTALLTRLEHGFSSPLPPVPPCTNASDSIVAGKNLPL